MRTSPRFARSARLATIAVTCLALVACGDDDDGATAAADSDGAPGTPVECVSDTPTTEVSPMTDPPTHDGEVREFEADNGTVQIPSDPERIIATGYAVPVLLEADADLVGISEWSRGTDLMSDEDLAEYEELTKVAGDSAASTNYEAVANAEPDLIILGVPLPALADLDMDRLEAIAPVAVIGPNLPDGWKELSRRHADAAGELEYYNAARTSYEAKAAELTDKWADVLERYCFGHVGSYGEVSAGEFHREYAGSWGTNIATDIGVRYYGGPVEPGPSSAQVTEYPSIEELPASLGEANAITYTVDEDGAAPEAVAYVLDHELWKTLPAVQAGNTVPLALTQAATYPSAERTLDAIDAALTDAFGDELD